MYLGHAHTLFTPSQLQRVAMSAPCRQRVLTQALLKHIDKCMQHENVVKKKYASAISTHIDRMALQLIY